MLKSTMNVLENQESKNLIWRTGDEIYYSKGVTDPYYCVLQFTAKTGRYYSDFHSTDFSLE